MRKVPTEKDVSRDAGINDGGGNADRPSRGNDAESESQAQVVPATPAGAVG